MKRVAAKRPAKKFEAGKTSAQPLSKFALTQTRARLKRVAREIKRATKHPKNPDTAHDLRVAIRRFTQCLRIFHDLLEPRPVKRIRKTLRKLMDLCGAKRDYDVGLEVLADAGLPANHPAFAHFREHRDKGTHDLVRSLEKKHKWDVADHWAKELAEHKQRPGVVHPHDPEVEHPALDEQWIWPAGVRENARRILPKLAEEFFRQGDITAAARGKLDLLHPFRLRGKRFRYTLEVFVPCYGDPLEAKILDLRGLQDRMGQINDCMVVLKLPGMNRVSTAAVRRLLAARDDAFRTYWSETFSPRHQESWKHLLANPQAANPARGRKRSTKPSAHAQKKAAHS